MHTHTHTHTHTHIHMYNYVVAIFGDDCLGDIVNIIKLSASFYLLFVCFVLLPTINSN